jgi:membrane-bound metal-dependent hydrolase YbcI (DUF457 family)
VGGGVAGAAAGYFTSDHLPENQKALYVLTCTFAGILGGLLPDALEPAASPSHRGACHSLAASGLMIAGFRAKHHSRCLELAEQCDKRAASMVQGSAERVREENSALLWRLLGAALLGLGAGYMSHLVLDGVTPAGLPLIVKGI